MARSADSLTLTDHLFNLVKKLGIGFLLKSGLWSRLINANLILGWFEEFRSYWVKELGLRPISLPDFHYLRCNYRSKFQTLLEVADDRLLDQGYHDHRSIYLLFQNTYKNALTPLHARGYIKYIPQGGDVLEFGCGLAPIATSLAKFYGAYNLQITCADLEHLLFHYVRWKFADRPFVRVVGIDPADDDPLRNQMYDVIFCMTVFEHVPRPLQTMENFFKHLKSGGTWFSIISPRMARVWTA